MRAQDISVQLFGDKGQSVETSEWGWDALSLQQMRSQNQEDSREGGDEGVTGNLAAQSLFVTGNLTQT